MLGHLRAKISTVTDDVVTSGGSMTRSQRYLALDETTQDMVYRWATQTSLTRLDHTPPLPVGNEHNAGVTCAPIE